MPLLDLDKAPLQIGGVGRPFVQGLYGPAHHGLGRWHVGRSNGAARGDIAVWWSTGSWVSVEKMGVAAEEEVS